MPNLNDFINWCINTCNASSVGYSQTYRNQQTVNGVTYYDCSSFVNYALIAGGWSTPSYAPDHNAFTTYTMIPVLLELGWEEVDITGEWKQGDILWRSTHTEVVYSGGTGKGVTMGAHSSKYALARQVSINTYTSSTTYPAPVWTRLFRYSDSSTTPTKPDEKISMYVVAAMCGNFFKESQINPGVWENLVKGTSTSLNKGLGLGQWTNTEGDTHGRLYKMWTYCKDHGGVYNGDAQCDYIVYENEWTVRDSSFGINSLTEFLNSSSTDIESLARCWARNWEGVPASSTSDIQLRVDYARLVLNYLTSHATDEIEEWTNPNDWITQAQILDNAVLVYQHFNAESSGINPEPEVPAEETTNRVVLVSQGDGYVNYSPHIAESGETVSGGAYANNTSVTFDRWVIRYPYDLTFNHTESEDQYNSTFNFTMPDATVVGRAYFSDFDGSGGYSDSTTLTLLVTGSVSITVTWYTQDGGSTTQTINFDSNENKEYTYSIGITDDVHIFVNDGCTITPVTRYVPGWTYDESTKMYFFFQPDVDVVLNVTGKSIVKPSASKGSKWWMYMRPAWTWNQLQY